MDELVSIAQMPPYLRPKLTDAMTMERHQVTALGVYPTKADYRRRFHRQAKTWIENRIGGSSLRAIARREQVHPSSIMRRVHEIDDLLRIEQSAWFIRNLIEEIKRETE